MPRTERLATYPDAARLVALLNEADALARNLRSEWYDHPQLHDVGVALSSWAGWHRAQTDAVLDAAGIRDGEHWAYEPDDGDDGPELPCV